MIRLLAQILAGILTVWIASFFLPGVLFLGTGEMLILAGMILGLANFLLKPILLILTFPLRLLTLGLFSFIVNLVIVWLVVDVLFFDLFEIEGFVFPVEITMEGFLSLFSMVLILWITNLLFSFLLE